MTAKFTPSKNLTANVAAQIAPTVARVADAVQDKARAYAPPLKQWQHMNDAKVRPTHRHGPDGRNPIQDVPENLRFVLRRVSTVDGKGGGHGLTYMQRPHDETCRDLGNLIRCRCTVTLNSDGIAELIHAGPAKLTGKRITAQVVAEGPWIVESEYGTAYPLGGVSPGRFYMTRARVEVAAARAARTRGRALR